MNVTSVEEEDKYKRRPIRRAFELLGFITSQHAKLREASSYNLYGKRLGLVLALLATLFIVFALSLGLDDSTTTIKPTGGTGGTANSNQRIVPVKVEEEVKEGNEDEDEEVVEVVEVVEEEEGEGDGVEEVIVVEELEEEQTGTGKKPATKPETQSDKTKPKDKQQDKLRKTE